MKLISLNIWGGHEIGPLSLFLAAQAESTDIFCFQEVYSFSEPLASRGIRLNIFEELKNILPGYAAFFAPIQDSVDDQGAIQAASTLGQAIFIRHSVAVEKDGFVFACGGRNTMRGDDFATIGAGFQYARWEKGENPLTIVSVHGPSSPGDKLDTPRRRQFTDTIQEFLKNSGGRKILCGDFNLMPETESVRALEKDMKNLIRDFGISNTRGAVNARKYPHDVPQKFADYCFVSPDVKVISFEVPDIPVSDHLPLILEFS